MGPRRSPAGPGTRCRRPPPPSGPQLRHPEIPARKCRPVTPATAPAPERSLPFPATGRSRLLRPAREVRVRVPRGAGSVGCRMARPQGSMRGVAAWGAGQRGVRCGTGCRHVGWQGGVGRRQDGGAGWRGAQGSAGCQQRGVQAHGAGSRGGLGHWAQSAHSGPPRSSSSARPPRVPPTWGADIFE